MSRLWGRVASERLQIAGGFGGGGSAPWPHDQCFRLRFSKLNYEHTWALSEVQGPFTAFKDEAGAPCIIYKYNVRVCPYHPV